MIKRYLSNICQKNNQQISWLVNRTILNLEWQLDEWKLSNLIIVNHNLVLLKVRFRVNSLHLNSNTFNLKFKKISNQALSSYAKTLRRKSLKARQTNKYCFLSIKWIYSHQTHINQMLKELKVFLHLRLKIINSLRTMFSLTIRWMQLLRRISHLFLHQLVSLILVWKKKKMKKKNKKIIMREMMVKKKNAIKIVKVNNQ